jgi:hypothetical protein
MCRVPVPNPKERVLKFLDLQFFHDGPPRALYLLSHSKFFPMPYVSHRWMHETEEQIAGDALATDEQALDYLCFVNLIEAKGYRNKVSLPDIWNDTQANYNSLIDTYNHKS